MWIQLDSQIIAYERTGQGYPLILLHGNGGDHTMFSELISSLEDSYEIYAVDLRGHGESATPKEFHYEDFATDIEKFIEALGIRRPAVLGFSDGAIVAMKLAMKREDLLSALILCGGNLSPKGLNHAVLHEIKKNYKKTGDPLQKLMLDEPNISTSSLSKITLPTLVVAGAKDSIREKETKTIARAIPNSQLLILPNENHISYLVHTDKFAPTVRQFLKKA